MKKLTNLSAFTGLDHNELLLVDGGADGLVETIIEGVSKAADAIVDAAKFIYDVGKDVGDVVARWIWIPIFGKHQY